MSDAPASGRQQWIGEWATYVRLLRYVRPYAGRLVVGGIFGVVFAGSTFGLLPAVNRISHLVNLGHPRLAVVVGLAALLPVLAIARGVGAYLSAYLIQWVGNRAVMDIRVDAFSHLQNLSVAYYDRGRTGEMISRVVNDTAMIEQAVSNVLTDLARQPLLLVMAVGYVLYRDWVLGLASLVVFPVCLIPILAYGRRVRRSARQAQDRLGDMVSILQEAIAGVRIVKAFCMEERERARFAEQCQQFFGRVMRVVRAKESIEPITTLIAMLGIMAVFDYAAWRGMNLADVISFAVGLVVMYDPVKRLSKLHLTVQQSSAAADRIFELLDTPPAVTERAGARAFDGRLREIEFRGVSFAYDRTPVLRGIDLTVAAGERLAIVGASGAGKTTFVNLIPRFFDATEGALLLNGADVRDLTLRSLRRATGLVTQETFLFNDTVRNNIAYGAADASDAAVREAAARAYAHDFIAEMPAGYDTEIGERGVRLSGGQRQRLAIARAILHNPPILILDEATSALDTESERLVQRALDELMRGRTVFAIAHRLSTLSNCTRIVVLDKGVIAEQGGHAELMAAGGLYRRLYDLQFKT